LIHNLPDRELQRRLELLELSEQEIRAALANQNLPLYDRLSLAGDTVPEFFEEVDDPRQSQEPLEVFPDDESEASEMADIPAWAQQILAQQNAQLTQLTQLMQNNINNPVAGGNNDRPIRPEYIFDFSPTDSPDDTNYYLFSERITDMVAQYGEAKVLLSLVACLKNTRAKNWYTSLSDADKTRLHTSTQDWKDVLKRDFGIKAYRAKQLAQRETFSFSQGRPVLQYFDRKVACLRVAETIDEDMQCSEIKVGLRDPEFRSAIRLAPANNTIAWLRQELTDLESDCRALWTKSQRSYKYPAPKQAVAPAKDPEKKVSGYQRGGRGSSRGGYYRGGRSENRKEPLAIAGNANKAPPRPCRFCGGSHWDRECNFAKPTATAYHCYHIDMSQEDYDLAEEVYEEMQGEVFAVAVAEESGSNEEDNYYFESDNDDEVLSDDDTSQYWDDITDHYSQPEQETSSWTSIRAPPLPSLKAPPSVLESPLNVTARIMHVNDNNTQLCDTCLKEFPSRNSLFAHLRQNEHFITKTSQVPIDQLDVIESTADTTGVGTGYAFRDHNYCEIRYKFAPNDDSSSWGCLDTGSSMSLIDEDLLRARPWIDRIRLRRAIKVKGVNGEALDA
jgi:hypothetical protein